MCRPPDSSPSRGLFCVFALQSVKVSQCAVAAGDQRTHTQTETRHLPWSSSATSCRAVSLRFNADYAAARSITQLSEMFRRHKAGSPKLFLARCCPLCSFAVFFFFFFFPNGRSESYIGLSSSVRFSSNHSFVRLPEFNTHAYCSSVVLCCVGRSWQSRQSICQRRLTLVIGRFVIYWLLLFRSRQACGNKWPLLFGLSVCRRWFIIIITIVRRTHLLTSMTFLLRRRRRRRRRRLRCGLVRFLMLSLAAAASVNIQWSNVRGCRLKNQPTNYSHRLKSMETNNIPSTFLSLVHRLNSIQTRNSPSLRLHQ